MLSTLYTELTASCSRINMFGGLGVVQKIVFMFKYRIQDLTLPDLIYYQSMRCDLNPLNPLNPTAANRSSGKNDRSRFSLPVYASYVYLNLDLNKHTGA